MLVSYYLAKAGEVTSPLTFVCRPVSHFMSKITHLTVDLAIDRVDRSSRSFDDGVESSRLASEKSSRPIESIVWRWSQVDWPMKSRVDRSSRLYVFEVEPVDFQHLWSERNRFGNHPHHAFVSGVFKAGSADEDDMKLIGRLFVRTGNISK